MADYDIVFVGSGFACSFFLSKRLERGPANARYLVVERGPMVTHAETLERGRNSPIRDQDTFRVEGDTSKTWNFNIGFGGGSVCWWGGAPRMLPSDFRMQSLYGVGRDWPIGYDDLAPYYDEAEMIMQISGSEDGPFPNRPPYPLPGHRFNDPDRALKAAYPDQYFNQPTARASRPTATRGPCCANGICHRCPVDAKFSILNSMMHVYDDPRVTLITDAEVTHVETAAGLATGVVWRDADGAEGRATGDTVVLGANAIFNPYLLLRSGIDDGPVGARLHEQSAFRASIWLDGMEGFQGSSVITGHGYMLYDGPHRATAGATLIEGWNAPFFRDEFGRWTEKTSLYLIVEDLPEDHNRVTVDPTEPTRPLVEFRGRSAYFEAGMERAKALLPDLLDALPVERIEFSGVSRTEYHNQGSTVFGDDPTTSVVDADMIHHRLRNLYVVGNSVYPTGAPANPTLTNAALALRSGERMA